MESMSLSTLPSEIINIINRFTPIPGCNFIENKANMLKCIEEIEKVLANSIEPVLYYNYAILIRNYSSWYTKGKEKKDFIAKIKKQLENSISLNNEYSEAKIELVRMLIEESSIRDIDRAIMLIKELKKNNQLPLYMEPLFEKAKRLNKTLELPCDTNFSKLDPTPGALRTERTNLRALYSQEKKVKNIENMKNIILRLYNLALLVAYLYGDFDCNSGVRGFVYTEARKKHKKVCKNFKFNYIGRISGGSFLSDMDYQKIESILVAERGIFEVDQLREIISNSIIK